MSQQNALFSCLQRLFVVQKYNVYHVNAVEKQEGLTQFAGMFSSKSKVWRENCNFTPNAFQWSDRTVCILSNICSLRYKIDTTLTL